MSDPSTTFSVPQTVPTGVNDAAPAPSTELGSAPVSRRKLFAGAGALGAVAAAAAVLPVGPAPTLLPVAATAAVASGLAAEGGYQLTDHVKRYYETARV